jgi:hypothetical protein
LLGTDSCWVNARGAGVEARKYKGCLAAALPKFCLLVVQAAAAFLRFLRHPSRPIILVEAQHDKVGWRFGPRRSDHAYTSPHESEWPD